MSTHPRLITLTIIFILLTACGNDKPTAMPVPPTDIPNPSPTPQGTGNVARTIVTYDNLMNGFDAASPLDEAALTLPADAAPSEHSFEGRLELHGEDANGEMTVLRGNPNREPEESHLPEFDFEFVQHDGYLIPAQRGLIAFLSRLFRR